MTDDEFTTYFEGRYTELVSFYDKRAGENKRGYRIWSVYMICVSLALAASIPFVPTECLLLRWATSLLLASIAGASGVLAHFQFHEHWLRYRHTWDALRQEPHLRIAGIGDYAGASDRNARFVARVEALVSDEGSEWLSKSKQAASAVPGQPSLPPLPRS